MLEFSNEWEMWIKWFKGLFLTFVHVLAHGEISKDLTLTPKSAWLGISLLKFLRCLKW
ncbi:hypothetical protein RHGRI_025913 [Rhododendron griersonianum]|uniref:Uncharacterized protein n=1 Tax=Rhododendron griersonianum TaxID=479676 RepID=A0AAV6IQT9_9ERIC|nr:hypothetical protein RHGRI_025913 [Rhododendron griersonianum]